MILVLILGLLMNAIALPLAGRRVWFLYRVINSGQPAPDRIENLTSRLGSSIRRQVVEVFGQKKLLKWTVPGAAHFFVFWAFVILATVYLEAYGALVKLLIHGGHLPDGVHLSWAIPLVGHWAVLGFLQDFIAMMAFFAILVFVWIRFKNAPRELGRRSRFFGSHLSGAWFTLFMIFNVIWTMFLFRGAGAAGGGFPYKNGAFVSIGFGKLLDGLSSGVLEALEGIGLLLHLGVMLVFLIFVLHSKHLHIFVAPLNVLFGRQPIALGAAKPMMYDGKPLTLDDLEDLDEDATLGVGAAEDFSWKGILDFETCTECGRCQDQCPAWNTEKPLSPKLLIMALRDHTLAKAPYTLAPEDKRAGLVEANAAVAKEVERPMVGDTGEDWFYMPENGAGVIDPDVLWSCVTCGACVQQCPVDIEHVDHIIDMRRYQVLVESSFPKELNGLFKGMENKGNPWNMSPNARLEWAEGLPFDVKVVGGGGENDPETLDEVDWLFWVGCAGAYEDRAKKTTRAVAELLDMAGVSFAVLGNGETCTGDPARRAGNEFVFQGLAQQNADTFKETKAKKVVATCAHCFNTLKNEYAAFGADLEVVHHTQLLNRLVREKKLTPVAATAGTGTRSITYHDPCYLGRHNQVFSPPRELLQVIPDATFTEMPRNSERSFCCGAGGARMWMEETIGERINVNRTREAVATGADQIAVGCPFCRVMLSDGLTAEQSDGNAREEVEVLDVAQLLLASVKGEAPKAKAAAASRRGGGTATDVAVEAEPHPGDVTQTKDTVTDTADVGPAAEASGGTSLFDTPAAESPAPSAGVGAEAKEAAAEQKQPEASGGSLFDLEPQEPAAKAKPAEEPKATMPPAEEPKKPAAKAAAKPKADLESSGSLFDIAPEQPAAKAATKETEADEPKTQAAAPEPEAGAAVPEAATAEPESEAAPAAPKPSAPAADLGSGSLFDIAPQEPAATAEPEADAEADEPEPEQAKAAEPLAESEPEPQAESEAEAEPAPDAPIKSLKDIKAEHADESADAEADADAGGEGEARPDPEPDAAPEPESDAAPEAKESKPEPPAEPKKDIGSGSLFDL